MLATLGIKRELENKLCITEYENGNGDFHFHSQIELCIVKSGEIEALVNNKYQRLKKDEISVSLSYETHMYNPVVNSNFTVLIIPVDLCEEFSHYVKLQKITNPFIKNPDITQKISLYIDEIKKNDDNILLKTGYVYLLLGLIVKNVSFEESRTHTDTNFSSKLLMYINDNFKSDISLSSVAEHFGYNSSYISHFFKSNFNIGIIKYINILRLNNVIMLLRENKHSITYCAMESGFSSMRTFYRIFNSEFHCSPLDYMKMQNNK